LNKYYVCVPLLSRLYTLRRSPLHGPHKTPFRRCFPGTVLMFSVFSAAVVSLWHCLIGKMFRKIWAEYNMTIILHCSVTIHFRLQTRSVDCTPTSFAPLLYSNCRLRTFRQHEKSFSRPIWVPGVLLIYLRLLQTWTT